MSKTAPKIDATDVFIHLGQGTPGPQQVVLVPGHATPLVALELPAGLRGQAREQVARRQLADRMGLEDAQIAMRPLMLTAQAGRHDSWNHVLIIHRDALSQWQKLECRAVLPDYLSLPAAEGLWSLRAGEIDGPEGDGPETVMVRLGPKDGFSATPAVARAMLERALALGPAPRAVLHAGPPVPEINALWAAHNIAVYDSPEALAAHGLPTPVLLGHGELACDLRRDPLAARAQMAARVLPWRWPFLAAALAAALWSAAQLVAIERSQARTTAILAQTQAEVQSHFVHSGPMLDMRLQVARALSELRAANKAATGTDDPLALTGRAIEVLTAEGARPDSIDYRAGEGLFLVLQLADFAAAEQLATRLREAGLRATLTETRLSEAQSGVHSKIHVQPGEAAR